MKLIKALNWALIFLAGCTSSEYYRVESACKQAVRNFTYVPDIANEYKIYDRIDRPFSGDCEDFAFTLQRQIGGDVYYTFVPRETDKGIKLIAHAVLVLNERVYDMEGVSIAINNFNGQLLFVMTYEK